MNDFPPYSDSCEECLAYTRTVVRPAMAVPDGDGGLIAAYRCPACGHTWTCAWGVQAGPQPPTPPVDPVGLEDLVAQLRIRLATQPRRPQEGEAA
ncbi:hypothetical protein [Streptomyces sp. GESEQ-13]|uniref:hypothetical protein n=1 Tax=Streptomyces sp. GESEQ-13 TaxID=2812654 RepID=UPI001B33B556